MRWIRSLFSNGAAFLFLVGAPVLGLLPLGMHVWWCIGKADETGSAIALLIVGLAFFPLGWLHGVSILLGLGDWL